MYSNSETYWNQMGYMKILTPQLKHCPGGAYEEERDRALTEAIIWPVIVTNWEYKRGFYC